MALAPVLDIDDLLKEHASDIENLRSELLDVLGEEHDDIYLLRYILRSSPSQWIHPTSTDMILLTFLSLFF